MKNRENKFKRQNQTQKTRNIMKNTRTIKMKSNQKQIRISMMKTN